MFQPLKGRAHLKAYVRNKHYKQQYKQFKQEKENVILNLITKNPTFQLVNNSNTFYIVSPSLYKTNHIQLTTFINNQPHSHLTLNKQEIINELYSIIYIQEYTINTKGVA